MGGHWHYMVNGRQHGPVSWERLKELMILGVVQPTGEVWKEGSPDWMSASSVPGLCSETKGSRSELHPPNMRTSGEEVISPSPPAPRTTPPIPSAGSRDDVSDRPNQASTRAAQFKDCPFCGEQVLHVAKKCKHCGETIDVVLRVAEEAKKAMDRPAQVFMNAGGASSSSSSSAAASGAGSRPSAERVRITLKRNARRLSIAACIAIVLCIPGILAVESWGLILIAGAIIAIAWGARREFYCSFCEKHLGVSCFTEMHKCRKCGLIHVIDWD